MVSKRQQLKTWSRPAVPQALYYEQHFGWIKGMNLDRRLTKETKRVLTILALEFRNKKTGECYPSMRRLAMWCGLGEDDNAIRMARRALEEAEKLGWIRRHPRFGGDSKYNQSNSYEFLAPDEVTPAGLAARVKLKVVEHDCRWYVAQVKDGVEVCGPYKTREDAETWMMEHGPDWETRYQTASKPDFQSGVLASRPDKQGARPDKIGGPTGQNRGSDRTHMSGNNLEEKHRINNIEEDYEHSVLTYCRSDERHRPLESKRTADRPESHPGRNNNLTAADSKQEPPPLPREAATPSPPPDIEALAETVRGGRAALAPLLYTCMPMKLGALIHSARLTNEELDVAGFLKCGAVYREGELIYPAGCIRRPDGSYDLPGYDNRWIPSDESPEFDASEVPF